MPTFTVRFSPAYFAYKKPFDEYIDFVGEVLDEEFGGSRWSNSKKGWDVRASSVRAIHSTMRHDVLPAREAKHRYLVMDPYYITDRDGGVYLPA